MPLECPILAPRMASPIYAFSSPFSSADRRTRTISDRAIAASKSNRSARSHVYPANNAGPIEIPDLHRFRRRQRKDEWSFVEFSMLYGFRTLPGGLRAAVQE